MRQKIIVIGSGFGGLATAGRRLLPLRFYSMSYLPWPAGGGKIWGKVAFDRLRLLGVRLTDAKRVEVSRPPILRDDTN